MSLWFGAEFFTPKLRGKTGHFAVAEGRVAITLFWGDLGEYTDLPTFFALPDPPRVAWLPARSPLPKSEGVAVPLWPIALGLLGWVMYAWRRRLERLNDFRCLGCGYQLVEGQKRCPECGMVETADRKTTESPVEG